jgi:hypothetical protein
MTATGGGKLAEVDPFAERRRVAEQDRGDVNWALWGPYVAERQWGTVREDYSANGDAWHYLTHDDARSRAYRWGEDGIAGLSDSRSLLCFSVAMWNGNDPFIKERLYGVANHEGNHGEDVKELYFYLDAVPSHAYLKYLYKYPHAAFPYADLLDVNARRSRAEPEYEILDTGLFDDRNYFDVTVEYAKSDPDDIHIRINVCNRGDKPADLALLPQLCFRNMWAPDPSALPWRPRLSAAESGGVFCEHPRLGIYFLTVEDEAELLFCENETNTRLHGGEAVDGALFKDGINDFIVHGTEDAISRSEGTKVAVHQQLRLNAGESKSIRLRLSAGSKPRKLDPEDMVFKERLAEADAFYDLLHDGVTDVDRQMLFRQAAAGLIWSKQFYRFDLRTWLNGDQARQSPPVERQTGRNANWRHLTVADVLSMPDKWEYPWYAAWDLAFQCLPLAHLDSKFAKNQLQLLTREWYMHPNGQLPAYEWEFGDTNPPVHAWAAYRVFEIDRARRGGRGDLPFLEGIFHKLLINFTWWVNRKDTTGRSIFQGGFLGLDNIGVFDRSRPPSGIGVVHQADGTAWMAMYALNMMRIALELAMTNDVYESTASKFFEHFLLISQAMTDMGGEGQGLWDEQDEFYYDKIEMHDGRRIPLRIRSMVGLVPLFAVEVIDPGVLQRLPDFARRLQWVLDNRPDLAEQVSRWAEGGVGDRKLLSLLRGHRMKALLRRMLDEDEFLSPHGIRSLSKAHRDRPFTLDELGGSFNVSYDPADSTSNMFGGNSNWRGPVWMPMNYMIIESLRRFHSYYGDSLTVEYPTNSGIELNLSTIADRLEDRLLSLFAKDDEGNRPIYGPGLSESSKEIFEGNILFPEFFDGDTGRGLGALHQTGWTALVMNLLSREDR